MNQTLQQWGEAHYKLWGKELQSYESHRPKLLQLKIMEDIKHAYKCFKNQFLCGESEWDFYFQN